MRASGSAAIVAAAAALCAWQTAAGLADLVAGATARPLADRRRALVETEAERIDALDIRDLYRAITRLVPEDAPVVFCLDPSKGPKDALTKLIALLQPRPLAALLPPFDAAALEQAAARFRTSSREAVWIADLESGLPGLSGLVRVASGPGFVLWSLR